jgi:predicted acyl esterase
MRGQGNSGGLSNLISITEAQDLIEFVNYVKHDQSSGLDSANVLIMGGSQGGIIPYMAACNGMNVRTVISALASPEFASSWIENGSIKMTFVWTINYTPDTARYSPEVITMQNCVLSSDTNMWKALDTLLPRNRNFTNKVSQNTVPMMIENAWQDKFFNAYGNLHTIPLLTSPKRYYFGAVMGHGGDTSPTEDTWHENFFNEWFYYWLYYNWYTGLNLLTRPLYHFAYTTFPENGRMWSFVHDSSTVWPPANINNAKLYFNPNNKLRKTANTNNNTTVSFANKVSGGITMTQALDEEFKGSSFTNKFKKASLTFDSDPLTQNMKMIGTPSINLDYISNVSPCQFNFQIYEVNSTKAKLITRVNYTDRHYKVNNRKTILINGLSHSHIFTAGNKIRIIVTNLDTSPADDSLFLGTNPHVLPVLKNGTHKMYLSNNCYINLPIQGTLALARNIKESNENTNNVNPVSFSLNQNYPNPFNPTTQIEYSIPNDVFVSLKVYDLTGREVATLVNANEAAGTYTMSFNANIYGLSSGIYFYKLVAGNEVSIKKMTLIK